MRQREYAVVVRQGEIARKQSVTLVPKVAKQIPSKACNDKLKVKRHAAKWRDLKKVIREASRK